MDIRADHIALIARYSMRFSMRTGGGLMYLLVLLITGLTVAAVFISPLEMVSKQGDRLAGVDDPVEVADQILQSDGVRDAIGWITGTEDAQTDYLLRTKPALLSAIMLVLLMVIPYTTCIGGFNQTSGDIASKGLRFLLLRTERVNIYLGRLVGATLFTLASSVAVVLLIVAYIHFKFGIYSFGSLLGWGMQGLSAIFLLSLPYLALCAWISGTLDTPFGSLALSLLAAGFSVVFLLLAKAALVSNTSLVAGDLDWLMRLVPWGWKYDLLDHSFATRAVGILAQLGFTTLFLVLGVRSFNRRDL